MALVVAELMTLFKGDDSGVETVIKRTENRRKEIDGSTATVKVDGDDSEALRSFDEVLAGLREIDSSTARAVVQADIDTAQAALRDLAAELEGVDQTRAEAEVHAEVKRALSDLEKAERALEDLDATVVRPRINPDGLREFRDEANGTAREAAASFDGSFESAADAVQETAANALAGFGPIGAAAGLAVAAGLGIVLSRLTEISEATNAAAEEGAEWSSSFNGADQAGRLEALRGAWSELAAEVRDSREVYELWQDRAVTAVEQVAAAADLASEDVSAFMASFEETDPTVRLESLGDALESVRAQQQALIDEQNQFSLDVGKIREIGDRREALERLGDIIEEQKDKQEAANDIERANARVLGLSVAAYREHIAVQERAAEAQDSYNEALTSAADPVGVYNDLLATKEEAEQRTAEATAEATSSASDSWEDYAKDVTVTTGDLIRQWQRQATEAAEFQENLAIIAAAGGQAMADELRAKGPEIAGSVAAVIAEAGPKQQAAAIASHAAATGGSISRQMADTLVANGWRLQRAVDGTVQAAHPKSDIVVTVTDQGSADAVTRDINNIPSSKVVTITTIQQVWGGTPTGTGSVLKRAGGGPVVGPGTGTSDEVLIAASNGEFVVNTKQTQKHRALLEAINAGVDGFATGGEVGVAQREVERRRRDHQQAWAVRSRANRSSNEQEQEQAAATTERTLNALRTAQDLLYRLRQEAANVGTQLRRGEIGDSVTGGLSSALGVTDQLRDLAASGDVGRWRKGRLNDVAGDAERSLTKLYQQAEKAEERLAAARDRLQEMQQISDQVAGSISGGFSLGDVRGAVNPWSGEQGAATGKQILAATGEYRAKAQKLALSLRKLEEAGYGGSILQEVANNPAGIDGGIAMADALLSLSPKDAKQLREQLAQIDTWAQRAGQVVTEGFGGGGLAGAEAAVKAGEAYAASIDKNIERWGAVLGRELAMALGISARANGGPVVAGHAYLVNENTPNSELFVPDSNGTILNRSQMAGMGGASVTHNWNITQHYPVNEPLSVSAAKTARQLANVGRR